MTRKCPYCGEYVPSNSVNCPKCYRDIPRDEYKVEGDDKKGVPNDRAPSVRRFDMKIVILLALIPAAMGLMGMGQMYEREYGKGFFFLIPGLMMFIALVFLFTNFGSFGAGAFLAVVGIIFLLILYIGLYAVQAFDAIVRSIIPFSIKM